MNVKQKQWEVIIPAAFVSLGAGYLVYQALRSVKTNSGRSIAVYRLS